MKKTVLAGFVLVLLVAVAVLFAGCVGDQSTAQTQSESTDDSITVTKIFKCSDDEIAKLTMVDADGDKKLCIGDSLEFQFTGDHPLKEHDFNVEEKNTVFSVDRTVSDDEKTVTLKVTMLKSGVYNLTIFDIKNPDRKFIKEVRVIAHPDKLYEKDHTIAEFLAEYIPSFEVVHLATSSLSGIPNVAPMGSVITNNNKIIIANLFMSKTLANIQENPNVAVLAMDKEGRYCVQFKGTAEIKTDIDEHIIMNKVYSTRHPGKPLPKSVVVITVNEVYSSMPNQYAGQQIL